MIVVGIKTVSGMNAREHPMARSNRVKREREAVAWVLTQHQRPAIPCTVLLTRCAMSGGLDDDNLASALKGVRDAVAKWIGVDDRHSNTVHYVYTQCRAPWSVRIAFGEPASGAQLVLGLPVIEPVLPDEPPPF